MPLRIYSLTHASLDNDFVAALATDS